MPKLTSVLFLAGMTDPFSARSVLFLTPPDSDMMRYLDEAHGTARRHPEILRAIDSDLDRHALEKKELRQRDAEWEQHRSMGLFGIENNVPVQAPERRLGVGRPRTPALLVYLALALRGYQGGFKTCETTTVMLESVTWTVMVANLSLHPPQPGTLDDLVGQVSNPTRTLILDKQIEDVMAEGWDDFLELALDSTAVEGNTQWPKDSHLMVMLAQRLLRVGSRLDRVGLPVFEDDSAAKSLKTMRSLDKRISMGAGKKGAAEERVKLYDEMLGLAGRFCGRLERHVASTRRALEHLDAKPSVRERATRVVSRLNEDLENLTKVRSCCRARVLEGKEVPVAEKVLSVSDPDVGFIAKGGREPVVGYKPQLARSGAGFVTAFALPRGNAADASQLVPMFDQAVDRTQVMPRAVTVDDGYAFAASRDELLASGVEVVSVSGSKGKRITPEEDWNSPEYADARNQRSAVESLMSTIKHNFDFGRVARRGMDHVTGEMLEKVLAYNFCQMSACRALARKEESLPLALAS